MKKPSQININLDERTLEIGGVDVADSVSGFQLTVQPGTVPVLMLEMMAHGTYEGEAEVTVVGTQTPEELADLLCQMIDKVNPGALEQEALQRMGMGDSDSVVGLSLQVLKEEVRNACQS